MHNTEIIQKSPNKFNNFIHRDDILSTKFFSSNVNDQTQNQNNQADSLIKEMILTAAASQGAFFEEVSITQDNSTEASNPSSSMHSGIGFDTAFEEEPDFYVPDSDTERGLSIQDELEDLDEILEM